MDEIKPADENDDQVNDQSDHLSGVQKIQQVLSVVTIEPVVFFHYLAFAITIFSQNQMIVYKTCRGFTFCKGIYFFITSWLFFYWTEENYNLSKEYCWNIEEHTNDTIYDEIENEVDFDIVISSKYCF